MGIDKDINLMPLRHKSDNNSMMLFTAISVAVLVTAVIFLFAYILPQMKIDRLKQENSKIAASISSIGDLDAAVNSYTKKQEKLKKIKDSYDAINKEKIEVLGFLENLKKYIPENVFLSSFLYNNNGAVNLNFITYGPVDVAKLIVKLRQMNMFESVDLSSIPLAEDENIISLSLKIKKEGVQK